jgi:hypothetical protein
MTEGKVEQLHTSHPQIRAEDWRAPLICRLLKATIYAEKPVVFDESFRDGDDAVSESQTRLTWTGLRDDFQKCVNTYQDPVLTEYAALGLSCMLVTQLAKMEITEVTLHGDRADYWLGDKELLLEVSGTLTGDLDALQQAKALQLRENPFEKDGYVCVANFETRHAQLWFHAYE